MVQAVWIPTPRLQLRRALHLDHRPRVGLALGAPIGALTGLHRRLRRRPVLHRHPRRPARLGAASSSGTPGPDDRPARQDLPAARRRAHGVARRRRSAGSSGILACVGIVYSLSASRRRQDAATASRSARSGRGRRRRRRRARRSSARSGSPTATRGRRRSPPSTRRPRHHRAAGRPDHPDGHRVPGPDHDRGRPRDDVHRDAAPVRPLRVRDRRQPGGRRARRHQRPPDDHARPSS